MEQRSEYIARVMTKKEEKNIEITVNGDRESIPHGMTVADLIDRFREHDVHLVVELNSRCVFPANYDKTLVEEGDFLEFVHPNFGG